MAKGQRAYTEEDKASALVALDANRGNVYRTALQLGVPRATLQEWRDGRGTNAEVTTSRQLKKGELSERFESVIHSLLDAVPKKIAGASLKDLAWTLGVFTDKMLALDGEATPGGIPPFALTPEQQRRIERLKTMREGLGEEGSEPSDAVN